MTYRHNLAFTAAGQVRVDDIAVTGGRVAAASRSRMRAADAQGETEQRPLRIAMACTFAFPNEV